MTTTSKWFQLASAIACGPRGLSNWRILIARFRTSVQSRYPGWANLDEAETWTGFRPMTPDGPAMIGRGPRENLYLTTGHGTFGWTLSAGSAALIAQVIDGEEPVIALDAFRPGRFME